MKKLSKSVLVGIIITAFSFTSAYSQKIAHINLDSLVSQMPEYKKAQEDVQLYYKQLEQQITAMQTEFQEKYAKYLEEKEGLAQSIRNLRESELKDLDNRIQGFQQQAQLDYQAKSADLIKPITEKANKAIEEVAKEKGYKYVLDTSSGVVIYFEETDNIFPLVVKKLALATPAKPAVPAVPASK